ncbi:MAG: hypothetical protein HYR67_04420 [Bacteroidetes bacterium]|nr:hypothetical protein [Bacteroidota bacterium]
MKEAFVKSLAVGLSDSIKKYEVLSFLKKPFDNPDFDSTKNWCVDRIPITKNYKAAFALKADKVNSKIFDYNIEEGRYSSLSDILCFENECNIQTTLYHYFFYMKRVYVLNLVRPGSHMITVYISHPHYTHHTEKAFTMDFV